jgi:hypothetical protein
MTNPQTAPTGPTEEHEILTLRVSQYEGHNSGQMRSGARPVSSDTRF